MDILEYSAIVGASDGNNGDIGHYILLDGTVVAQDPDIQATENATSFTIPISSDDRFLTLAGTGGLDEDFLADQGIIGNPTLILDDTSASVPFEFSPGLGLVAVGGASVLLRLKKKLSGL